MSSIVQNMLQKSIGDGARPTKFEILFQFTGGSNNPPPEEMITLAKATSLPSKSHSTIDLRYKGRSIPIKGQTKYSQTWECTFYLTEDHKLKNAFENWIEAIDQQHNYMNVDGTIKEWQRAHLKNGYTTTIMIFQKDFDDKAQTAKYILHNVFPTEVSPVQYSYEQQGQIQEFTVTFSYSYFTSEVMKGRSGNFIDTLVGKFKSGAANLVQGAMGAVAAGINNFIGDAVGDSLGKLNDWAKGLSTDIIPPKTSTTSKDLVSGGLGAKFQAGVSSMEQAAEDAGKSVSSAMSSAKKMAAGAFDTVSSKVKSLF